MKEGLIPPDPTQCQALIPKGNAFTLGGQAIKARCENVPTVIAAETSPGADGQQGSMSVCEGCRAIMVKQFGADIDRIAFTPVSIPTIELFPGVQFRRGVPSPGSNQCWEFYADDKCLPGGQRWLPARHAYADDVVLDHMAQVLGERDALMKTIADPRLVFENMKAGAIAKISLRSAIDLHGEVINGDDAQQLEIARLRAEVAILRKLKLPHFLHLSDTMRTAGDHAVIRAGEDGCASVKVLKAVFFEAAIQRWLNDQDEAIGSMQASTDKVLDQF